MKSFYKVLLTITLLSPIFSFAQSNYKQGFVVNLKGDTLKGYIDLKEWTNNPTEINFKTTLDKSAPNVYTVNDINYFEMPKIVAYKTETTSISLNETNLQRLQHERDTTTRVATVFLKEEVKGNNVTLYSYEDNLKQRFYIYDSYSKNISELIYRHYFVENNTNNVSTTSQEVYKQQLLVAAQKYNTYNDDLQSMIQEADYQRLDLKAICKKINNSGKSITSDDKSLFGFYVSIGTSYNNVNLTGLFPLFNLDTRSKSGFSPRISAAVNLYPSPDVRKSVIRFEVAYFSTDFKASGNPYFTETQPISTYTFKQHNFSLIPQFLYNFYNTDALKVYGDIGVAINISKYSGDSYYNPVNYEHVSNFGLAPSWFSFPVKAGITLNQKFDISLAYVYKQSITNNAGGAHQNYDYEIKIQSVQFGIGYIF